MLVLVPGDVLRPRRPDEHFAGEVEAARAAGIEVGIVDHDALTSGGSADAAVARVPAGADAVYRGWMLRASQYEAMADALARRGVTLRTSADDYRKAHELPGWYAAAGSFTPESVWTSGDDRDGFTAACAALGSGAAVLRDYSKSMKHHWHEAAYIRNVVDLESAWKIASRFRELREDEFTGGFVLRRFESLTGAEVRTWWVGGVLRLVTAHPDTPDELPPDVDAGFLQPVIAAVGLPFVTADLARHSDGRWRLIEIGDGQVSDRPSSTPAADLIGALHA